MNREQRKWRNDMWVVAYYEHRQHRILWSGIFMLAIALAGIGLLVLPLFGKFARP